MITNLEQCGLGCERYSAYDYDGLSLQELLCQFFTKINACIDDVNTYTKMVKELNDWIRNEGLQQEVIKILEGWKTDGTLDDLINKHLLTEINNKVDNFILETKNKLKINIEDFPRLPGELDDSERFQRCIDSIKGNYGACIVIPKPIKITKTINIHKTGITIEGYGQKQTIITCDVDGIAINVDILKDGVPYTNLGYCKFSMNNIKLQGIGHSTENVGLSLQYVYASPFYQLYTAGFKNHIVLKGSHLNSFYSLYCGGEGPDTVETFNKACGISAESPSSQTGETTSNNNSFFGGVFHNATFDLRNMKETLMQALDIEPAGWTCYLGDNNTLKDCRLERFDVYEYQGKSQYGYFPWIIINDGNVIKDCKFHQSGLNTTKERPILKVEGSNNNLEVKGNISMHELIRFNNSTGNNNTAIIDLDYQHKNFSQYSSVNMAGLYTGVNNKVIFRHAGTEIKLFKNKAYSQNSGATNFSNNRLNDQSYTVRTANKNALTGNDIPYGIHPSNAIKVGITSKNGGLIAAATEWTTPGTAILCSMTILIKVISGEVRIGYKPSVVTTDVSQTNDWKMITIPFYDKPNTNVRPTFVGDVGTEFALAYVGYSVGYGLPNEYDKYPYGPVFYTKTGTASQQVVIPQYCINYDLTVYSNHGDADVLKVEGYRDKEDPEYIEVVKKSGNYISGVNPQGTVKWFKSNKYIFKYTTLR